MRSLVLRLACVLTLSAAAALHAAEAPETRTNTGFEKLKLLAGSWHGTTADGKSIASAFELTAGGTAIVERLTVGDEPPMVTLYYCDGSKVMLTHYCSLGNQPRMRAMPMVTDSQRMRFEFVDITNLASKGAPHMHDLTLVFGDADHLTEEWTRHDKGEDQPLAIQLERAKP